LDKRLEVFPLAKAILLLLILLGALFYFPKTRPTMVETFAPMLDPVFTWQTRDEMDRISRELQTLSRQGSTLPTPGESFQNWMGKNFFGGAKTDAWGTMYTMQVSRDSVNIVSNGPDLEIGTADDLSVGVVAVPQRRNR
jgi:hypothetical protein